MTARRTAQAVAIAAALLAAGAGLAQERILDFASEISIQRDGSLLVVETITVQVEGMRIKRGILRDFPTRYENRRGAKVIVPFHVLDVRRDGVAEPYAVEALDNGQRVRIGRGDRLLPHGPHTYRIAYRTERQLGFFEQHDELYWNVTGNGWPFAIDRARTQVRLPQPVVAGELTAEAFTGYQGARGRAATSTVANGEYLFEATQKLQPNQGLTIVAAFPKGIVAEPSELTRLLQLMQDNLGSLIGIAGLAGILTLMFVAWWRLGRDPREGPLFPRYEPPANMSAAAVRFIDRMGFDSRCLAAAVLGLGARGYLKVTQEGEAFAVQSTKRAVEWLPGDKPVAEALFGGRTQATLGRSYDPAVAQARDALRTALKRHYRGSAFRGNAWPLWLAPVAGVGVFGAAVHFGANPVLIVALVAVLLLALFVFSRLMPAYTRDGRRLQDQIEGLRQYLGVAERDDLARMKAPELTPAEFARMLPYALALDVERTWADRFAAVMGATAVAAAVSSYYSSPVDSFEPGASLLADSLGALDSTVSSAATPPGSSSGSSDGGGDSGGGSSGGGGGGGGGDGW